MLSKLRRGAATIRLLALLVSICVTTRLDRALVSCQTHLLAASKRAG